MYLLAYYRDRGSVVFSLVGDISKARRRLLHHPSEGGLPGCRVEKGDENIFINNVGIFGAASASYWRGRIAGAGIRLARELLEALEANSAGRRGVVLAFLFLAVLGFPFKWSKQRVDWFVRGLHDYALGSFTFEMNLGDGLDGEAWQGRQGLCKGDGTGARATWVCCKCPLVGEAFSGATLFLDFCYKEQTGLDEDSGYVARYIPLS